MGLATGPRSAGVARLAGVRGPGRAGGRGQESPEQGAGAVEVLGHRAARALGVARQDRIDDGGVLLGGVHDVVLQHRDRVQQVVEPHPGVGAGGGEQGGAGEFRDRQVEQGVEPSVVLRGGLVDRGQPLEQDPLAAVAVGGGQDLGGAGLQRHPEGQRVGELGGVRQRDPACLPRIGCGPDVGHKGAAEPAATRFDIARLLQRPDGLTQRDTADPQQAGQFPLGREPVSGRDHPQLDHGQQALDRLLEGVARPYRAEQGGELTPGRSADWLRPAVAGTTRAGAGARPGADRLPGHWGFRGTG